ncbi:MAG TPA: efflux RND transporter periplasmic adaptor subunit [Terriglobia bacterium]|nr:efflux RND transporter periplasmic adaptor subunit [Terriglobia bacterium]
MWKSLLLHQIIIVALLPLLYWGCSKSQEQAVRAADAGRPEPLPVRTASIIERRVERTVEVVGTLKADQEVVVSSELRGTIEELPVDLGSVVRQGQVLARLSSREFQLRVDQAEAALQQARSRLGLRGDSERLAPEQNSEVRQAKAALDEARLRYDRATTLIKNGDIPQERYDQAEIGFQSAEARYQAAQDNFYNQLAVIQQRVAELQLARKELNDATIRSPLDGSVSVRHVTRGEYIKAETPIVTIVKSNPLRLQAVVPEVAVSSIRVNIPVTLSIDAYPGQVFKGSISRISPSLDEKARTLTVEATVANAGGTLKPGLFAKVQVLVNKQSPAVMAPVESLLTFAGLTKLFVIENNQVVERVVKTGRRHGDYIEILEGAKVGERVAVENLGKLTNGLAVTRKES